MSDLDSIGRHHAEVVWSSLDDLEPPPLETLSPTSHRGRRPRAGLIVLAGAAVVVAALLPVMLLGGSSEPSGTTMPTVSSDEAPDGT